MTLKRRLLGKVPAPVVSSPFEFLLSVACVLGGLGLLTVGARPNSLEALMPSWFVTAWGVTILVGGVSVIYGMLKSSVITELFGLRLLTVVTFVYGLAIILILHLGGLTSAFSLLAISASFYFRTYTITESTKIIAEHMMDKSLRVNDPKYYRTRTRTRD